MMDNVYNFVVLDNNLNQIYDVDSYQSIIWTDRTYTAGDFELKIAFEPSLLSIFVQDYFLWTDISDRLMIIEELELDTDLETGNIMTVRGRSVESVLDRRCIWSVTTIFDNIQNVIYTLLVDNVLAPIDTDRTMNNIVFFMNESGIFDDITIDAQYFGENVYETICSICEINNIGWKMIPIFNDDASFSTFVIILYIGEDRTYDSSNDTVIFSQSNDNILSSNYLESRKVYKNTALVGGEGEGVDKKIAIASNSDVVTNWNRRELYVEANDISMNTEQALTPEEYTAQLQQRGLQELEEYPVITLFDGEVDALSLYKYNRDFFMGDIVETVNVYGQSGKSRITEFIISIDESGYSTYPTFVFIE